MCYLCVHDSRSRVCVRVCVYVVRTLYARVHADCPRVRASMFFYYFCFVFCFCFILFSFHFVASVCVLAVRARCLSTVHVCLVRACMRAVCDILVCPRAC